MSIEISIKKEPNIDPDKYTLDDTIIEVAEISGWNKKIIERVALNHIEVYNDSVLLPNTINKLYNKYL